MKVLIATSVAALAGIATGAHAAQLSVSGGITVPLQGSATALGPNSNTAIIFTGSGSGATVEGLVQATSTVGGNVQVLTLVLTNFSFTSSAVGTVVIDVNIVQNYTITAPGAFATGSHQLNGNTTGVRNGNIVVTSTHESTILPVLNYTFLGADNNIGVSQGQTTTVTPIDTLYTINTTYRFTIQGGSGSGSIILPDSGVDNATLVLVPLPMGVYAGLGGLALVGLAAFRRRNKHND